MATEIAKQLIYDLRNDEFTREHFSIRSWNGKGTCGTVGCIAGTAVAMAGLWKPSEVNVFGERVRFQLGDINRPINIIEDARKALGLPDTETARDLFLPMQWPDMFREGRKLYTADGIPYHVAPYSHLPSQARPALETVEQMKAWASLWCGFLSVTPDEAANALEQVTVDEIPYVNWKRAVEEVSA